MRLSEIAEYVVDNNPDCCVKNEVIRGCRTESYEESLIEPLLNFYMYEKMDLCGCGIPENTYEAIRRYLHIRKSCFEENLSWEDVTERYRTNLHIDYDDSMNYGDIAVSSIYFRQLWVYRARQLSWRLLANKGRRKIVNCIGCMA